MSALRWSRRKMRIVGHLIIKGEDLGLVARVKRHRSRFEKRLARARRSSKSRHPLPMSRKQLVAKKGIKGR